MTHFCSIFEHVQCVHSYYCCVWKCGMNLEMRQEHATTRTRLLNIPKSSFKVVTFEAGITVSKLKIKRELKVRSKKELK